MVCSEVFWQQAVCTYEFIIDRIFTELELITISSNVEMTLLVLINWTISSVVDISCRILNALKSNDQLWFVFNYTLCKVFIWNTIEHYTNITKNSNGKLYYFESPFFKRDNRKNRIKSALTPFIIFNGRLFSLRRK